MSRCNHHTFFRSQAIVVALSLGACSLTNSLNGLSDERMDVRPELESGAPHQGDADSGTLHEELVSPCDLTSPFGAPVLIPALSGPGNQGGPKLSYDELHAYFVAASEGSSEHDLFATSRSSVSADFGPWIRLENVSTPSDELDPMVTIDGLTLLFTRAGDIFLSTRPSLVAPFAAATSVVGANTSANEVSPWLQPDGAMYFSSSSGGDYDLFRATLESGAIDTPVSLTTLNSPGNDACPVLSPDSRVIYFSSTRDGGSGRADIWTATRESPDVDFGEPWLVAEVNSPADDFPSWISPDGCRLYLGSSRDGTFDGYVASRPATNR